MRGDYLIKILDFLKDQAISQADFFAAVLASGYGASMGRVDYEYAKREKISEARKFKREELRIRKRRLSAFLSKMKRDGLILERIKNEDTEIRISKKGKQKLLELKNKKMPEGKYKIQGQNNPVIISFDIPEKMRRKRDWLRDVIKNLGFSMIHQSLWVGHAKIPKEFVADLEDLKILEFVEIFEISKSGTLKKLTEVD